MIRPLILVLALLAPSACALTLDQTLAQVATRSSVVSARAELNDAQQNLMRVKRDPLAVRADTLQAKQRLTLAGASLEHTRYVVAADLVSAYTGVLDANAQVALAQQRLALSRRSLRIAQIRLENGSATQLELGDAQASLDEAQNGLRAGAEAQTLALNNLVGVSGLEVSAAELAEISETALPSLPPLQEALRRAEGHPDLLSVEQQAALTQLSADVLDPLYAAQAQIDSAQSQQANAASAFTEAQRSFKLQVRNLYTQAANARATLRLENIALRNAQARLQTQQQQFDSGFISQIDFDQARLMAAQAGLEAQTARSAYLNALLALQSGSLVPLGQPFSQHSARRPT